MWASGPRALVLSHLTEHLTGAAELTLKIGEIRFGPAEQFDAALQDATPRHRSGWHCSTDSVAAVPTAAVAVSGSGQRGQNLHAMYGHCRTASGR